MFIKTKIFKEIGLFDERFFMYLEDTDLCRRIGEKYETIYYPEATVYHEYSKESYRNIKLLKIHIDSARKYFDKWGWFSDKNRI
jgi:GT2 family glycosyltransferase